MKAGLFLWRSLVDRSAVSIVVIIIGIAISIIIIIRTYYLLYF